jgi:late competence protein required for DNA uptake (superfamily II DNA/RNA helicase)
LLLFCSSFLPQLDFSSSLFRSGSYMSTLVSEPTSLVAGANAVQLRGVITPANKTASDILIDRYLTAQDTLLVAVAGNQISYR